MKNGLRSGLVGKPAGVFVVNFVLNFVPNFVLNFVLNFVFLFASTFVFHRVSFSCQPNSIYFYLNTALIKPDAAA